MADKSNGVNHLGVMVSQRVGVTADVIADVEQQGVRVRGGDNALRLPNMRLAPLKQRRAVFVDIERFGQHISRLV